MQKLLDDYEAEDLMLEAAMEKYFEKKKLDFEEEK